MPFAGLAVLLFLCAAPLHAQSARCLPAGDSPCFLRDYVDALEAGHRLVPGYQSAAENTAEMPELLAIVERLMRKRAAGFEAASRHVQAYHGKRTPAQRDVELLMAGARDLFRQADSLALVQMREIADRRDVPSVQAAREATILDAGKLANEALLASGEAAVLVYDRVAPKARAPHCSSLSRAERAAWRSELRRRFGTALDTATHEVAFSAAAAVLHQRLGTWNPPPCRP